MRNNETHLVEKWAVDVAVFYQKAKAYVESNAKRYKRVYFAKSKDGKWGVTLPGVFNIHHSANNCPDGYNDEIWATAWSMKVDQLLACGDYTYLEWCKTYNYLNRKNNDWCTNAEYIRQDMTKEGKEYMLYIPQTGHGYVREYCGEDQPNFTSLKTAIYRRNQKLYTMVMRGADAYGKLEVDRINKFKRVLVKGYLQAIKLRRVAEDATREEKIAAYEGNLKTFVNVLENGIRFCEDETLRDVFAYYKQIFDRTLAISEFDKLRKNEYLLREYFKSIGLFFDTSDAILYSARHERKRALQSVERLLKRA